MSRLKKVSLFSMAVLFAVIASSWSAQSSITAGDITGGKKAPHVNIAIFHKLHGQESFSYPDRIADHDILQVLQGKAQYISMNHTAGLIDGDIITLASDVLREGAGSEFADFGVDCQLSIHIKGTNVTLAGICQILMIDQDNRKIEHKAIVKTTTVESGKGWVLLYYDAEDGIAIYADGEVGME